MPAVRRAGSIKSTTLGLVGLGMSIGAAITREVGLALLEPTFSKDRRSTWRRALAMPCALASACWPGGAGVSAGGRI